MATNMKSLNGYGFDASALGGHDPSYYAAIDDTTPSSTTTYSSQKIESKLTALEAISHEYTVTLTASGWTGGASPFTQTVAISGILATDSPIADLDVSSATADSYGTLAAAWACVGRITTQAGQITATCFETKPTVDMTVRLMTVR